MTERWRTTADELGLDVTVSNRTLERGMVAVQGPDAIERVETATDDDVADLEPFLGARDDRRWRRLPGRQDRLHRRGMASR